MVDSAAFALAASVLFSPGLGRRASRDYITRIIG
jgi:hypothetical protein